MVRDSPDYGARVCGVMGQNHGAGKADRVVAGFRNAVAFCLRCTIVIRVSFVLAADTISSDIFGLSVEASDILWVHSRYGFGAIVLSSMLIPCGPVFHHFGRSVWTTILAWKGNVVTLVALILIVGTLGGAPVMLALGAPGAVCAVLVGSALCGTQP